MFDVSWTDPSRQTVGERKNRKQSEDHQHSDPRNGPGPAPRIPLSPPARAASIRSSRSGDSNVYHTAPSTTTANIRPSFLNIFGSGPSTKVKNSKPAAALGLGLTREKEQRSSSTLRIDSANAHAQITRERRLSSYTPTSEDGLAPQICTPGRSTTTRMRMLESERGFAVNGEYHSDTEQDSPSDVSESIFSERTGRSTKTNSTWSSALESTSSPRKTAQPLSPTSFVTPSTEVTVSPRASVRPPDLEKATIVHVSAAGAIPIEVHDSPRRRSTASATYDFPIPRFNETEGRSVSRLDVGGQPEVRPGSPRAKRSDDWNHPHPETWGHPLEEGEAPVSFKPRVLDPPSRPARPKRADSRRRLNKLPSAEMMHLQRMIRRMEAASDRIILERLKEEWVEVADASVYRELELEKQLWMLMALRRKAGNATDNQVQQVDQSRSSKVLSLYENHASCSSLSALTSFNEVHHLSTLPLSPKVYPNIRPVWVPGPTSELPYGSNTFASINAFSLPALLPASSIPTILKECHRTLVSAPTPPSPTIPVAFSSPSIFAPPKPLGKGGVLHLTILDPAPLPSTLGPRLRAWLDNHLILNLEKQFRCINPGRLFPEWLADAGLRAPGSTILPIQFLACYSCHISRPKERDGDENETRKANVDNDIKQELKSVVGRMLWKEMWGSYVQAEKWWWEDQDVVNECERMGTCWEYAVIEAVKQG